MGRNSSGVRGGSGGGSSNSKGTTTYKGVNADSIAKAIKGESFKVSEMQNFKSFDEAKGFFHELQRKAAEVTTKLPDSGFAKMYERDINESYYAALHADSGYMANVKAQEAMAAFKELQKLRRQYGV